MGWIVAKKKPTPTPKIQTKQQANSGPSGWAQTELQRANRN